MDLVDVIKDVERGISMFGTRMRLVRTLNARGLLQELTAYSVLLSFSYP